MDARSAALLWSYLNILTKERYDALLQVFGDLQTAAAHIGKDMLHELGCRPDTVAKALLRMEEFDADHYQAALRKRGIHFLTFADADYPSRLTQIGDPPPFLYARGDLAVLRQPCVGLVGTRAMSPYGKRVTETFTAGMVAGGVTTVSGLAEGVDAAVAEETLRTGGRTAAVLGHGLGMIYPSANAPLSHRIVEGGGVLLSEFALDTEPGKYTFPARNRIIAGLSLATVVLEAPRGSGAIITAELALEYGRDVFAVPGLIFDPQYDGCHALLAEGKAGAARDATDVLRAIGVIVPSGEARSTYEPEGEEERTLFALLSTMPQDVDALVRASGMDTGRVNAALTMMELAGGAQNVGGGQWVRR
jgi:DNA processing protein